MFWWWVVAAAVVPMPAVAVVVEVLMSLRYLWAPIRRGKHESWWD